MENHFAFIIKQLGFLQPDIFFILLKTELENLLDVFTLFLEVKFR